jgi:rod shape-determining protein MreD
VVIYILPSVLVMLAVMVAIIPWSGTPGTGIALLVMPYMVAHLFLSRGTWFVPSPLLFFAGLVVDLTSDGPLGFWALIYLFGALIARQLTVGLHDTVIGRVSGILLIVFALAAAQVGVASAYQLDWVDWHIVLMGTGMAGVITMLVDVMWRERRSERDLNVTARGGNKSTRAGARHV